MPIVIRELVVRANVTEKQADASSLSSTDRENAREELIKECVEQVMGILKQKTER